MKTATSIFVIFGCFLTLILIWGYNPDELPHGRIKVELELQQIFDRHVYGRWLYLVLWGIGTLIKAKSLTNFFLLILPLLEISLQLCCNSWNIFCVVSRLFVTFDWALQTNELSLLPDSPRIELVYASKTKDLLFCIWIDHPLNLA